MDSLPAELVVNIFRCLRPVDVCRFRRTSKRSAEIIARNGIQWKIPVKITIDSSVGRVGLTSIIRTKISVRYANYQNRLNIVTIVFTSEEEKLEGPRNLPFTEKFLSAVSLQMFWKKFLPEVTIEKLRLPYGAQKNIVAIFGNVFNQTACQIKEIHFDGFSDYAFLGQIKKKTEKPLVFAHTVHAYGIFPELSRMAPFYKLRFLTDDANTFGGWISMIASMWESGGTFMNPAGIIFEGDIRWAEEVLQLNVPDGRCVSRIDKRTLNFEKTIINGQKLLVTYCAE